VDHWRDRDGHRREWTPATGVVSRDEIFANTRGTAFSPSVGVVWQMAESVAWRASAYRGFRVPTLNELYRPFRVGNVATEANPALRRETVTGAETGVEFNPGPWRARVNVFQNDLHDGVANVTLSTTPTLTQRQRLNLDSIRVRGLEAGFDWRADPRVTLGIDVLLVDTEVRRAPVAPDLEGNRLAQVPRMTVTLGGSWTPAPAWRLDASVRAISSQYDDDENMLPLAAATVVDLALRRELGPGHEIYVAAENVFDARVETGVAGTDLVTLAPGRWFRAGWSRRW
jgi:outer membrane receptor protein involved in Fe transport